MKPTPRLPTDPAERKKYALSLVLDYFGDALCEVAEVILKGQEQHGTSGWDRTKSTDHDDCLLRHFLDRGTIDVDKLPHSAKLSWRALARHQIEVEARKGLPPPRGVSAPAEPKGLDELFGAIPDFPEPPAEAETFLKVNEEAARTVQAFNTAARSYTHLQEQMSPERQSKNERAAKQLNLPFTGPQLTIQDVINLVPLKSYLRVVVSYDTFLVATGTVLFLEEKKTDAAWFSRAAEPGGALIGLSDAKWRFELV